MKESSDLRQSWNLNLDCKKTRSVKLWDISQLLFLSNSWSQRSHWIGFNDSPMIWLIIWWNRKLLIFILLLQPPGEEKKNTKQTNLLQLEMTFLRGEFMKFNNLNSGAIASKILIPPEFSSWSITIASVPSIWYYHTVFSFEFRSEFFTNMYNYILITSDISRGYLGRPKFRYQWLVW